MVSASLEKSGEERSFSSGLSFLSLYLLGSLTNWSTYFHELGEGFRPYSLRYPVVWCWGLP